MTTDETLRANYYCASAEIRRRVRLGQPIPDWLRRHVETLDAAIRSVAHTGQDSGVDLQHSEDGDHIGTADVARLTGLPLRSVIRRSRDDFGAVLIGKSLVYRRSVIEQYMKGNT
jgi:hypothetical protein